MKTSEVLRAAKALIDTPEKWQKVGSFGTPGTNGCALMAVWEARDAAGLCNFARGEFALARCAGYDVSETFADLVRAREYIYKYNDALTTTHADIMALFDRAIAAQELEEAFAAPAVSEPFVEVPA
jgi:hypothetical protein